MVKNLVSHNFLYNVSSSFSFLMAKKKTIHGTSSRQLWALFLDFSFGKSFLSHMHYVSFHYFLAGPNIVVCGKVITYVLVVALCYGAKALSMLGIKLFGMGSPRAIAMVSFNCNGINCSKLLNFINCRALPTPIVHSPIFMSKRPLSNGYNHIT